MDESSRLRAEIAYWSNLIKSHKRAEAIKSTRFPTHQLRGSYNDSSKTRAVHHQRKHSMAKKVRAQQYALSDLSPKKHVSSHKWTNFNNNKPNTLKPNASKYKWKPQLLPASASTSMQNRDLNSNLIIAKKHLVSSSVVKKGTSANSSGNVKANKYTWTNSPKTSSKNIKLQSDVGTRKKVNQSISSARSRHVWRRRRSSESRHKHVPLVGNTTVVVKEIIGKYKLRRVHSKARSPKNINVSNNPYKVIRKVSSQAVKNQRCSLKSPARIHRLTNTYHERFGFGHHNNKSKYIFVRKKPPMIHIQTRNPRSGNIVLKRKQTTRKEASLHIKQHYFYSAKQKLASQVLQKSLHTARHKNRHKLRKVFCLFYNRFGRCNRGDKCQYVHDPARVAVCTRFLRGTCRDESCLFSHKISKKKVPVCSFFLQGKCSTKDCPYLHVFVGHAADVCTAFATTGYCQKADNCKQKHIRVCPDFYNKGTCAKGVKCSLPHQSKRLRKRRKSKTITTAAVSRSNDSEAAQRPSSGFIGLPQTKNQAMEKPVVEVGHQIQIQPRLGKKKRPT